ncbi:hypothetical protein CMUST_11425 [Corynebacterium mustelae]|uniref:Uncharacterized protein n=1 Tax=Corynebacterium mustelae TaxID=571915 RepID=A0A0G3GZL1_9CORY|nr:hypothetical protein [Corynebacterium mustelae]AKK06596.1 hypothetical protein CMUST_11425 [Corynebacterium mustelae]
MKDHKGNSTVVTWILVALLAAIFIGNVLINDAHQSTFISCSMIAALAALAFVGFRQHGS